APPTSSSRASTSSPKSTSRASFSPFLPFSPASWTSPSASSSSRFSALLMQFSRRSPLCGFPFSCCSRFSPRSASACGSPPSTRCIATSATSSPSSSPSGCSLLPLPTLRPSCLRAGAGSMDSTPWPASLTASAGPSPAAARLPACRCSLPPLQSPSFSSAAYFSSIAWRPPLPTASSPHPGLLQTWIARLAEYRCARLIRKSTMVTPDRIQNLTRLAQSVEDNQIPGDFIECGVYKGGTGADLSRVRIVPGLFQQTLPTVRIPQIALLNIDADWYESVKLCLDTFYDAVASRGFVSFDDYHAWPGCRLAVDEFFQSRGLT